MKNTLSYALAAVLLAAAPAASAAECVNVSSAVTKAVAADQGKLLEIVNAQVLANEKCACEVVKAAIVASEADKKTVAAIVEAAVTASPENLRLVAQCATAVAPDAVVDVQKIVERLDRAAGGSYYVDSSKGGLDSSKGGIGAPQAPASPLGANPLDFPAGNGVVVGPRVGSPGGFSLLPTSFPTFPPVVSPFYLSNNPGAPAGSGGSDTDGSDTDGSDTDGSGTDGSGTDGSGTDGSGTDGSDGGDVPAGGEITAG